MSDVTCCRLCLGETRIHFTDRVLQKYDVDYQICGRCHSLQTEEPYWLDEAYGSGSLADSDTGGFMRCINNLCVLHVTSWVLRLRPRAKVVDFGGGTGLLCRMLRDFGFDARVSDRYAPNEIARGFDDQGDKPEIICSFEVAEHFANPQVGMAEILSRDAAVCIVGTTIYGGEGKGWWYISPHSGQHVFFYSHEGMKILADQYGYHHERVGSLHFFLKRPLRKWQSSLLWRALLPGVIPWVRGYLALRLTNRFAEADMNSSVRAANAPK